MEAKTCMIDFVLELIKVAKVLQARLGGRVSHMGEVVD
jgi:hypothetical protein